MDVDGVPAPATGHGVRRMQCIGPACPTATGPRARPTWRSRRPGDVGPTAGRRRRGPRRGPSAPAASSACTASRTASSSGGAAAGGALDDEHDLARRLAVGRPRRRLEQRAPPHLLVQLGQLAGDGDPAVGPARGHQVGQRPGDAVGRLVEHDRARLGRRPRPVARCAAAPCGAGSPRTRTVPAGSPLTTSAASAADGPGTTSTGCPARPPPRDQPLAGVGHAGHAGVGDERHPLAAGRGGRAGGAISRASVCSLTDHERAALDAGERQQLAGAAGVLAAHDVGRGQRLGRPGREVAEVADRRADEHEPARCGHPLTSSWSPTCSRQRPNAPASASMTARDRHTRRRQAVAGHGHDPQHAQVAVAEGHVDREPHADRVHRPARAQQQRAVDAVAAEQAPRPGAPVVGDLEARQHLAVTQQPGHGSP